MSKEPPPPNQWQPSSQERIAHGLSGYHPTVAAANPLSLQQSCPLPYWPLPMMFSYQGVSLQQPQPQMTQVVAPATLPISVNNGNDDTIHRNNNDLEILLDDMEEETNVTTDTTVTEDTTNYTDMLREGQIFANVDAFNAAVDTFCNDRNYDVNRSTTRNKNVNQPDSVYYRVVCVRSGKFKSESKGGEDSRTRTSNKVNCGFKITGRLVNEAEIRRSNGSLKNESVKVISLQLEHTNGCKGSDELVRATITQQRGRKYLNSHLAFLHKECKAGRYKTTDVQDKLTEYGYTDVTLKEATNLRYRLMNDKNIKGYEPAPEEEEGKQIDYLFNHDLQKEIEAGGQQSVDNLVCVHEGLSSQIKGYDYKMVSDDANRFSGTAWQTGRMRRRLRDCGKLIFLDDSRSGINTAGFCFWNVVVIDHNGKVQTVMAAMTMSPTNEAAYWVLSSMVQMTPEAADIVQCVMSDLGVGVEPIRRALPNVGFCGACVWHIMTIDFPKNVGHIADYESCKNFVYKKLVRNTVDKAEWENYLLDACQLWPTAASYLHKLARDKTRWGSPWRYEHFTAGYESSSPVEGSFSSFQRYVGDDPLSFVGVVQRSCRKDREKLQEERVFTNRDNISRTDPRTVSQRSDAENECATLFSSKATEYFEVTNKNSQNYSSESVAVTTTQSDQGATEVHEVRRRVVADKNNPPRPRNVMKINGVLVCGCKLDINWGMPCDHIQCVLGGAFLEHQFSNHWRKRDDVVEDPTVGKERDLHATVTASVDDEDNGNEDNGDFFTESSSRDDDDAADVMNGLTEFDVVGNDSGGDGGIGVFVTDYATTKTSSSSGAAPNKRRKRKLDHTRKFNLAQEEGTQIADIIANEKEDTFYKMLGVLRWLRCNIRNKSETEIKAACADYMGIDLSSTSNASNSADDGDKGVPTKMLAPLSKRGAGSMSTKRFKSCVEKSQGKAQTICKFCYLVGHTIKNCTKASQIGVRLTKANYVAKMGTVSVIDKTNLPSQLDSVVPSDALGLQIVSCVCHGLRSEASDHTKRIYCCNIVLRGMNVKVCRQLWFERKVIDNWTSEGKSTSHYVFLK